MLSIKRRRIFLLSSVACLFFMTARADQVVMKNGDRVTGSIIKKDGNNLTIKTTQFGVVTASWDQVESVLADKRAGLEVPAGPVKREAW